MNVQALLIQMQSWMQQEIATQTRIAEALAQQEDAVRKGGTDDLARSSDALEEILSGHAGRERRRLDLIEAFGRAFGVAPATLTIGSIAQRAGSAGLDTATVLILRDELRERVELVGDRARRLSTLAHYHGEVLTDILRLLGQVADGTETRTEGVLVDAEA